MIEDIWSIIFENKNIQKCILNQYFDEVYYINLDRRKDRKIYMERMLSSINISYKRFEAVASDKLGFKARLACKQSHINLIELAAKNNFANICILEDDCVFIENFQEILVQNIEHLPNNWDILYLGHCFDGGISNKISSSLYETKVTYCTHAYCLNNRSYNLILDKLNSSDHPIDHIYKYLCSSKIINGYIINPGLVNQIPNLSDIGEGPNSSKNLIL